MDKRTKGVELLLHRPLQLPRQGRGQKVRRMYQQEKEEGPLQRLLQLGDLQQNQSQHLEIQLHLENHRLQGDLHPLGLQLHRLLKELENTLIPTTSLQGDLMLHLYQIRVHRLLRDLRKLL